MPAKRISRLEPVSAAARLQEHLASYADLAIEQGAAAAETVSADRVVIDDRVRIKCRIPQCSQYGLCYNCPPHSPSLDEIRRLLQQYHWGVAFRVEVQPEVIVWEQATQVERSKFYRSVTLIANALESAAFYDGHYLALGFGAGSCKTAFCREADCLALSGKECRFSLRARPSMESVGMDVFALSLALGWDVYPVGSAAKAEQVPGGMMMGLVLVE